MKRKKGIEGKTLCNNSYAKAKKSRARVNGNKGREDWIDIDVLHGLFLNISICGMW